MARNSNQFMQSLLSKDNKHFWHSQIKNFIFFLNSVGLTDDDDDDDDDDDETADDDDDDDDDDDEGSLEDVIDAKRSRESKSHKVLHSKRAKSGRKHHHKRQHHKKIAKSVNKLR